MCNITSRKSTNKTSWNLTKAQCSHSHKTSLSFISMLCEIHYMTNERSSILLLFGRWNETQKIFWFHSVDVLSLLSLSLPPTPTHFLSVHLKFISAYLSTLLQNLFKASLTHSSISVWIMCSSLSLYVFNLTHELHIDVTRLDEYTLHALHELRLADERVSRAREDEEANSSAEEEENDRKEEDKTKQQFPLHFKWVNKREADA